MKRRWIASALCALSLSAGAALAQTDAEDACMQKGGTLTDGQCILSTNLEIKVDYPLELAANELVANTVDPFIQTSRSNFLLLLGDDFSPAPGPYALDISYETFTHSETMSSLVFTIYDFTGGAHGNTMYRTFTFDFANDRVLTLDDLFTSTPDALALIAPIAQAQVTEHLGADMIDEQWLEDGTGTNPDNYADFALDGDELVFYFPPYQVAAYAAGTQVVRIPLADLNSVLAPDFAS